MLTLDHVSKTYRIGTFGGRELRAVDDVSFDVGPGELVSLIGESGSGKSTIGRMVLGLLTPTHGTISFDGTDVGSLRRDQRKEYYRHVQGVFQDPFSSYNPTFKADRVFKMVREQYYPDVTDAEWRRRLYEALESVGLNPGLVLNRYPHQLSGGQLQRLLVGRALLLDIKLLVADEITSMLDASTRIDVLNLLADLKSRGLSVLFITHDLSLGYYISDRSVILYQGTIAEMGETGKVFDQPQHPYTQMLMASIPHMDRPWAERDQREQSVQLRTGGDERTGCVYYGRCPLGSPELGCDRQAPHLVPVGVGHEVACTAVEHAGTSAST